VISEVVEKLEETRIASPREIPSEWKTSALKRNCYIKGRVGWKGLTSDEFELTSDAYLVTGTDFQGKYINWATCYQVSRDRYDDDPFIQLRDGDLLITKDGTIGKTSMVKGLDKPACLNSGIFLVRPGDDYISSFLYWVLNSAVFSEFVDLTSSGSTIQHLYQNVFERFTFAYPSVEYQREIVAYLDAHTAKIDLLIGKQEQLIETLEERRQAVISQAVTKGLDPNAPVKDTGVEWLGFVPNSWAVRQVKTYFDVTLGKMLDAGRTERPGDQVLPYVRAGNIREHALDLTDVNSMAFTPREVNLLSLKQADLLVVEGGAVGVAVLLEEDMPGWSFQKTVNRVRARGFHSTAFLGYFLDAIRFGGVIDMLCNKSTIAHFTAEKLNKVEIAMPPVGQQASIVDFLDRETGQLEALSAKARQMIAVLKERRQALISAAVTGKIDVRGLS
jgi:type I restriction enzyme S subunit